MSINCDYLANSLPLRGFPTETQFSFMGSLGQGAFGEVYLAWDRCNQSQVAIKWLTKKQVTNEEHRQRLETEIKVLSHLTHSHICACAGLIQDSPHVWAILEYCPNGSLQQRLVYHGSIPEWKASIYFYQILSAVGHLHKQGYAHLDIKPANILLDSRDQVKLCDFGSVADCTLNPDDLEHLDQGACGTWDYMAPEVITWTRGKVYSARAADLWSCAVVLFEMFHVGLPFAGDTLDEMLGNMLNNNITWPKNNVVSDEARDLIVKILHPIPKNRLALPEICKHHWITLFNLNSHNQIF